MRKFVYGLSCVAAAALFAWWSAIAHADRGYWAVGGEYVALLLPMLVAAVDCALQGWRDERGCRGIGEGRRGWGPETFEDLWLMRDTSGRRTLERAARACPAETVLRRASDDTD